MEKQPVTTMKGAKRIIQKGFRPVLKQLGYNAKRLMKNPKKHLKRTPGARLEGMKKAKKKREAEFKRSTKAKLMRTSNAIGRRR